MKNKTVEMTDVFFIKTLNKSFEEIISKNKGKKFNIKEDKKKKRLKGKEYIRLLGLWNEYCEFLKGWK